MDFTTMTAAQLVAVLDDVDRQRQELREKARTVKAALDAKVVGDQLDHWGLTATEYAAAKAEARASGKPAHECLNAARAKANKDRRAAQTATVQPAGVGVKGKGV